MSKQRVFRIPLHDSGIFSSFVLVVILILLLAVVFYTIIHNPIIIILSTAILIGIIWVIMRLNYKNNNIEITNQTIIFNIQPFFKSCSTIKVDLSKITKIEYIERNNPSALLKVKSSQQKSEIVHRWFKITEKGQDKIISGSSYWNLSFAKSFLLDLKKTYPNIITTIKSNTSSKSQEITI